MQSWRDGNILIFELAAAVAALLQESRENVFNLSHLSAGVLHVILKKKKKIHPFAIEMCWIICGGLWVLSLW